MSSEAALAHSIELEALPVAAALVRCADGLIVAANSGFHRLFGRAPVFDGLAAEPARLAALRRDEALDGRDIEIAGRTADGTALSAIASVKPLADTGYLIATFVDVTEQSRREQALAEMAQFPRLNPAPVLRFNRSGVVVLANAAARDLFGEDRLLGECWWDLCPGIDREMWRRVLDDPVPPAIEATINGRTMNFVHVRSGAEIVAAFAADMTDIRQAQRELSAKADELAEIARFPDMNPGPVMRMNHDAILLLANAAARAVFGDRLIGRSWRDTCPGMTGEVWAGILATSGTVVPIEARIGEREFVFQHRNDPHSGLVFCFGADITWQKQAERVLRQSEKMATLGTLAAGVAHELNNPAAATRRAAEQLTEAFARLEEARSDREKVRFPTEHAA